MPLAGDDMRTMQPPIYIKRFLTEKLRRPKPTLSSLVGVAASLYLLLLAEPMDLDKQLKLLLRLRGILRSTHKDERNEKKHRLRQA